tara:strand:+ start:258 stop:413 length:156 start_codon:yes stop_codon:yes gene_type:complete
MKHENQFIPAILDRQIESAEADLLGHRHFDVHPNSIKELQNEIGPNIENQE